MNETYVTLCGNALTAPDWRRTTGSGQLVASFKVAASTRRLDRNTGQWNDGHGLRIRVTCWRGLAGGVAASVMVGDPVIVYGQMFTRDWVDAAGVKRTLYEMEALAVGHNLARGRARFARNRPVSASAVEEDPTEPLRLGGQDTEAAPEQRIGLAPDDPLNALDEPGFGGYALGDDLAEFDPAAILRDGGFGTPDSLAGLNAATGAGAIGGMTGGMTGDTADDTDDGDVSGDGDDDTDDDTDDDSDDVPGDTDTPGDGGGEADGDLLHAGHLTDAFAGPGTRRRRTPARV